MMANLKFSLLGLFLGLFACFAVANVSLECHTCDGINCLRTSWNKTQKCVDPLDVCITVFENFEVVQKGCSMEIPEKVRSRCDNSNDVRCHKCNDNRCNNLGRRDFLCVQCDSSRDSKCATDAANIASTRCSAPTAPNSYCYIRVADGVTQRGCSSTVKDQIECLSSPSCMLCMPGDVRGCNSVNFVPGSSRAFYI